MNDIISDSFFNIVVICVVVLLFLSGCVIPGSRSGFLNTNPCRNEVRKINGEIKNCRICQYDREKKPDVYCD